MCYYLPKAAGIHIQQQILIKLELPCFRVLEMGLCLFVLMAYLIFICPAFLSAGVGTFPELFGGVARGSLSLISNLFCITITPREK